MNEKRTNNTITLGSGKLFCIEFTGGEIPSNDVLEVEANRLAWIQGGAGLEYTSEWHDAEDDLGMVSKRKITTENVNLTSGIMTWNGEVLAKLCNTARVTEANGVRTVKIGGQDNGKQYLFRFLHEDVQDGDVRVTLVGQNTSGFTLTFQKDQETVIDATFSASKGRIDDEGTIVIIEEETAGTTGFSQAKAPLKTEIKTEVKA